MGDQEKFQALSKEWSALVDLFLDKTPEGQMALYSLPEGEGPIFAAILKACADYLESADSKSSPAKKYFGQQRHGVFVMAIVRLQEVLPDEYPNEGLARKRCQELYLMALNAAKTISHERQKEPRAVVPKLVSEAPLPDDVREALDMASQPGFDVSRAIEDAPHPDDPKEAEKRDTRRAPKDEMESLLASTSATPVIEPPGLPTVPVDSSRLGNIKSGNLSEMLKAYSGVARSSTSEPPPVHVSRYPASPPPAPKDDEPLGLEPSIPPPADESDQSFSADDAKIVAGDLLDPKALEEVQEAEIDAAFDEKPTQVRR